MLRRARPGAETVEHALQRPRVAGRVRLRGKASRFSSTLRLGKICRPSGTSASPMRAMRSGVQCRPCARRESARCRAAAGVRPMMERTVRGLAHAVAPEQAWPPRRRRTCSSRRTAPGWRRSRSAGRAPQAARSCRAPPHRRPGRRPHLGVAAHLVRRAAGDDAAATSTETRSARRNTASMSCSTSSSVSHRAGCCSSSTCARTPPAPCRPWARPAAAAWAGGQRQADLQLALLAVRQRAGESIGLARARPTLRPQSSASRTARLLAAPGARRAGCCRHAPAPPAPCCRAPKALKKLVIWNERTSPARTRSCVGKRRDVVAVEEDAPAHRLAAHRKSARSAWSCRRRWGRSAHGPRRLHAQVTWSVATRPPKRLLRPDVEQGAAALMALSALQQQASQAAARKQHHGQQHRARPNCQCWCRPTELLQQQQRRGADQAAPELATPPRITITISMPDCVQCSRFGLT